MGDVVPDFELPDQQGRTRRLSEFSERGPVVIYFYPAAMTTGCTKESCVFRDMSSKFNQFGAQRIGISRDGVDRQKEFSDRYHFDFPLLSDRDGSVATMFGARRRNRILPTKRWTFIVDQDRRIVDVVKSETRMSQHAVRSLQVLQSHSITDS